MLKLYRYDVSEMDRETYACLALTLPQTAVDGAELLGNRKPCRVVGGGVHAVPGAEPP